MHSRHTNSTKSADTKKPRRRQSIAKKMAGIGAAGIAGAIALGSIATTSLLDIQEKFETRAQVQAAQKPRR